MKQFTAEEQNALLDVLARHKDELCAFKGVHYVDVGIKFENGRPTDELAIRVHVHKKLPESQLESTQQLPHEVEGVPVDVIQSNPELQQNRDHRFDPLVGGVAVRNTRLGGFGTLGAIVFDAISLAPLGLSNHHVFVGDTGQLGDQIIQPASGNSGDIVGSLTRWNKDLDCAVCTINQTRRISREIVDYPQGIAGVKQPIIGTSVTKSGRTTGTTFGIIDGVSSTEFTMIPDPQRPSPNGEISSGGDSGSVWLDTTNLHAIGLHFAGEGSSDPKDERAWAKRMDIVANALNITFHTTIGPHKVVIYSNHDFQGVSQELEPGRYNDRELAIGNDHLSSLKVPPGLRVILYEHANFQGRTKQFTSDTPYVGDDFNDITSSIEIQLV